MPGALVPAVHTQIQQIHASLQSCAKLCRLCLQDDGLSTADMATVLDTFRGQSLDFFGALRSATYDNQIRSWIKEIVKGDIDADGAAMQELSRRLINRLLSGIPSYHSQALTILAAHLTEHCFSSPNIEPQTNRSHRL